MADTPKRLVGPQTLATTNAVLYTVPAGTTTIVRSIHLTNSSASASYTFTLALNAAASTVANQFFSALNVPPAGAVDWSGFLVLNPGDTVQGLASIANILAVTVSGVEVS